MNKVQISANDAVKWQVGPSVKGREQHFIVKDIQCEKVIESWKFSLFAHEWLNKKGHLLPPDQMSEAESKKRIEVMDNLKSNIILDYPVLGFGINDHIEIGAGRALFLTLVAEGYKTLPVLIPKSCLGEFDKFLA